jgi:tetratricopeptide (TPR) repeat protein
MTENPGLKDIIEAAHRDYKRGMFLDAAAGFMKAMGGYLAFGEGLLAAEMANNCCVAYLQAGKPGLALEVIDEKDRVFAEVGDRRGLAITLGNRGTAYERLNKIQEALRDYRRSADLLNELGEDDLYISTMQAMSALQLRKGRSLDAVLTMQAGINKIQRPNLKQRLIKKLLCIPSQMINLKK